MIKDKLKSKLELLLGLKCTESSNESVIELAEVYSVKSSDRK